MTLRLINLGGPSVMDKEQQKQANREAVKRYREKIRSDPHKHEERKAKQREWNKARMDEIKSDPIKYAEYLEKEKQRGKQKRKEVQQDPVRKEKRNKYYKEYTEKNKERVKKYQSRSPEQWKKINIARRYGITVEYYDSLLEKQNGLCAICLKKPNKIFVDHCHVSGIVRALLCNKCNSAIGLFHEDTEIINSAIQYLEKHKGLKDGIGLVLHVGGT
jgi:hypothetical protein